MSIQCERHAVVDANSFVNPVREYEPAVFNADPRLAQRHDLSVQPAPLDRFDSHAGGSYHASCSRELARVGSRNTRASSRLHEMTAWNDQLLTNPHAVADKRSRVQKMFAAIAPSYDLNNRLHSLWMDQRWRRRATEIAALKPRDRVVDVACGTGDLTIAFADRLVWRDPADNEVGRVLGVDFTYEMLPLARQK